MASPYEILGVPPTASRDEVTRAWRDLVKVFHPDAHPGASAAERAQWETAVARINDAYATITGTPEQAPVGAAADAGDASTWTAAPPRSESTVRWPRSGECDMCGHAPATPVVFREVGGRIIWWRYGTYRAELCRTCAQAVGRHIQNRTLMFGWWGVLAAFATMWAAAANTAQLAKVGRLDAPRRNRDVAAHVPAPLPAGTPVFARFGMIVLAAVVGVGIWAAVASEQQQDRWDPPASPSGGGSGGGGSGSSSARWEVGSCIAGYSTVYPVACSSPTATGEIIAKRTTDSQCPAHSDAYVDDGAYVWCIDDI